jgi:CheY-like chemotaxis protein
MPANVKVLLVDDNAMVLGMLRQALEPLALVSTASDGADALLKAVDDPPDLLISDYAMPGMDGRQLVEKLKSRPATAATSVILIASKTDINEKLAAHESVDELLEKPFFIKDATTRIKRVIDKIALEKLARQARPGQTVLGGSLAQMNVIDLVQSLDMGRKSCALTLTRGPERCELFFSEGQLRHAVYGKLTGDEAVYKVLSWNEGSFQMDFESRTQEQTTTRSTQSLLMEGLRLLDEARHGAEENEDVLDA